MFSSGGQVNVIPQGRLNAPMMKLLALVPLPNRPGDTQNYFNTGVQPLNRNNVDTKINWNRNERHQLFFKYSMMKAEVSGDFGLGDAGGPCLCGGGLGTGSTLVQIAGIGQTYTVSPTFLIDGNFGWTRFGQDVEPPDLGVNFGSDVLGIPGTNGPDPRESGMPPMYISGYSDLGNNEGWNPLYRNDQSYTANVNASWAKNTHDIRFGFDFVHHLMNHWQPELGEGPRGAFHFDPGVTALNPDALDASVGFQGWCAVVRERLEWPGGIPARHGVGVGQEQPVHQDEQLREPVRVLYPRSLARDEPADGRPGTAMGALPQSLALGRHGDRIVRPGHE